jgi:hypothetical protein
MSVLMRFTAGYWISSVNARHIAHLVQTIYGIWMAIWNCRFMVLRYTLQLIDTRDISSRSILGFLLGLQLAFINNTLMQYQPLDIYHRSFALILAEKQSILVTPIRHFAVWLTQISYIQIVIHIARVLRTLALKPGRRSSHDQASLYSE